MLACREVPESLPRFKRRSDARNLASTATSNSVPEASWQASTNPVGLAGALEGKSDVDVKTDFCNFAYADSGGNPSSVTETSFDEYAAEANRYGRGTSKAVKASGSENHELDAAGMSLRAGVYVWLCKSFLPRSESPLALPFIGEPEWLCEWLCEWACEWECEWACEWACEWL